MASVGQRFLRLNLNRKVHGKLCREIMEQPLCRTVQSLAYSDQDAAALERVSDLFSASCSNQKNQKWQLQPCIFRIEGRQQRSPLDSVARITAKRRGFSNKSCSPMQTEPKTTASETFSTQRVQECSQHAGEI